MKNLLALALVTLMVGGAVAQTPYNYEGCEYRLGIFLTTEGGDFVVDDAYTNIDYTQFQTFNAHLVLVNCPEMVSAYEMLLENVFAGAFNVTWTAVPGSGWLNIGNDFLHIAAFGFPQPNPEGLVKLGRWNFFAIAEEAEVQFVLGPATPSSIQGDGPALAVNQELVRTNFTPFGAPFNPEFGDYTGCEEELAPGVFPPYVATTYGDGVHVVEIPVATQERSLSSVKALFQ